MNNRKNLHRNNPNKRRTSDKHKVSSKKSSHKMNPSRFFAKTIFALLCFLILGGAFNIFLSKDSGASVVYADEHLSDLEYKVIEIKSGDSLWSIAKDNMTPGFTDINEYIDEVMECNQLKSDQITAGNYLLIPYYEVIEDNSDVDSAL